MGVFYEPSTLTPNDEFSYFQQLDTGSRSSLQGSRRRRRPTNRPSLTSAHPPAPLPSCSVVHQFRLPPALPQVSFGLAASG